MLDGFTKRITDVWWVHTRLSMPYFIAVAVINLLNVHPVYQLLNICVLGAGAYASIHVTRAIESNDWQYGEVAVTASGDSIKITDAANNTTTVDLATVDNVRRNLLGMTDNQPTSVSIKSEDGVVRLLGNSGIVYLRPCDIEDVTTELETVAADNADKLLADAL